METVYPKRTLFTALASGEWYRPSVAHSWKRRDGEIVVGEFDQKLFSAFSVAELCAFVETKPYVREPKLVATKFYRSIYLYKGSTRLRVGSWTTEHRSPYQNNVNFTFIRMEERTELVPQ